MASRAIPAVHAHAMGWDLTASDTTVSADVRANCAADFKSAKSMAANPAGLP